MPLISKARNNHVADRMYDYRVGLDGTLYGTDDLERYLITERIECKY
jgi:hypothetical protein